MGDTWLDNVFASFRVPTAARMKRLLGDRNSFWFGGAIVGTSWPWQAIGRFGWEPTAMVNTLRYQWGVRKFDRPACPGLRVASRRLRKALGDLRPRDCFRRNG